MTTNELPELPRADTVSFDKLRSEYAAEKNGVILFDGDKKTEMPLLKCSGTEALRLWNELRAIVNDTKLWPIIIGDKEALQELEERLAPGFFDEDITTDHILTAATGIDPTKWFAERPADNSFYEIEKGDWNNNEQPTNLIKINIDTLRGQPLPEVYIVLVPTVNSWEVPAYLRFGCGNNNPDSEEHVAILKHWYNNYGAELVSAYKVAYLELRATNPPTNKKKSMELAQEQFVYCPDHTHELGSLSALGSMLYRSSTWYFWWD